MRTIGDNGVGRFSIEFQVANGQDVALRSGGSWLLTRCAA